MAPNKNTGTKAVPKPVPACRSKGGLNGKIYVINSLCMLYTSGDRNRVSVKFFGTVRGVVFGRTK